MLSILTQILLYQHSFQDSPGGDDSSMQPLRLLRLSKPFLVRSNIHSFFSIMSETAIKLLREAQRNTFLEVLHHLKDKTPVPDSNPISKLAPILDDDGIIRVGGRLKNAQISFDKRHPILLPKDHHVTTLIIRHCHERVRHQGRYLTHGDIRSEGFHIVSGKRVIQQHINACILCRQLR